MHEMKTKIKVKKAEKENEVGIINEENKVLNRCEQSLIKTK